MNPFQLKDSTDQARTGVLKTRHGKLKTPFFMPVATKGSVKLISFSEIKKMGFDCLISNSFLLSIRPGIPVIKKFGDAQKFMGWNGSLFTDSGGFQILRDEFFQKIDDSGVYFRNPIDQSNEHLTPEKAIAIQNALGSDVAMCLDDVPRTNASVSRLKESQERTFEWAKCCLAAHKNKKQLLFGICQGGTNPALRKKSSEQIASLDFDGLALGGLCLGEDKAQMHRMVSISTNIFPENKIRYLMGVGAPLDLIQGVEWGVDCFDSAFPTQAGRHGWAFHHHGRLSVSNARFKNDSKPLDSNCNCEVCQTHSRAYLYHLIKTKEESGLRHLSFHNLFFVSSLMKEMRVAIRENDWKKLKKKYQPKSKIA